MGYHALPQGLFPTQGSNPRLPHCRWILYQLSHRGSPHIPAIQVLFRRDRRASHVMSVLTSQWKQLCLLELQVYGVTHRADLSEINVAFTHDFVYKSSSNCCSAPKPCLTFFDPIDCSTQALPSFTISQSLFKFMSAELVILSNCLIPCRLLLLLPSVFPSIRAFSNELALHIMWPKYWSFSFSMSPSNEYSGLISCRIDWYFFLIVQSHSII